LALAVLLVVAGLIWSEILTYIGLGVLGLYLVLCLFHALMMGRFVKMMASPEFQTMLEQSREEENERAQLHGEDLLKLSNEDLCEAIFEQNLAICEEAGETDEEISLFSGARRTVFVLHTFDMEVQNGGLCQFFVNSSRCAAPYVSEALAAVGAEDHRKLFDEFIAANHINVNDLDSFRVSSVRGFRKQTKRFDFDAFDDRYYELDALEEPLANYIRAHIAEF
jgi:hypothetical protein